MSWLPNEKHRFLHFVFPQSLSSNEKEKREGTDSKKKNMEEEKGEEKQQRNTSKFVGMLLETFRKI